MSCWSLFFFFKQKTAYEMRISDWSSDVCSSDLEGSVERLAIFDVMSGASDSRTDPRKPDIEVLLRRGPRLRRRELPRLSKRKAIGLVERDTPIGDIDNKGQAALKLGVYVGQRMNDEANRRAQPLVDFNLPCQPIFSCQPAFEVSQSFVIDYNATRGRT